MGRLRDRIDDAVIALARRVVHRRHDALRRLTAQHCGFLPDLATPSNNIERMQWRKVFDHDPRHLVACDKLAARALFQAAAPDLRLPAVRWIGTDARDIPDDLLRQPGMLKQSNACSRNIELGPDGPPREAIIAACDAWLAKPYGVELREWAYARIAPRLFVEEYLPADADGLRRELAFSLFGGVVAKAALIVNRKSDQQVSQQFDRDGKHVEGLFPNREAGRDPGAVGDRPPASFARARDIAERVGAGFDYCRVDFFCRGEDDLVAGEVTIYAGSGFTVWPDNAFNRMMNGAWDLRLSWFLSTPQPGWRGVYARALRRRVDRERGPLPRAGAG